MWIQELKQSGLVFKDNFDTNQKLLTSYEINQKMYEQQEANIQINTNTITKLDEDVKDIMQKIDAIGTTNITMNEVINVIKSNNEENMPKIENQLQKVEDRINDTNKTIVKIEDNTNIKTTKKHHMDRYQRIMSYQKQE